MKKHHLVLILVAVFSFVYSPVCFGAFGDLPNYPPTFESIIFGGATYSSLDSTIDAGSFTLGESISYTLNGTDTNFIIGDWLKYYYDAEYNVGEDDSNSGGWSYVGTGTAGSASVSGSLSFGSIGTYTIGFLVEDWNAFCGFDVRIREQTGQSDSYDVASFSFTVTEGGGPVIPEPATMLLFGSGLIGLAGMRRKFKK